MENVIEKLRELEAKVAAERWCLVRSELWDAIYNDILDGYHPIGTYITDVDSDYEEGGRWYDWSITVYRVNEGDKVAHFRLKRQTPATEQQEGGDFTFEFKEVVPREVTVIKYVPGRAA